MEETEAFRALGSADRQVLLHELVTTDGKVCEEELSRQIAARRHQISPHEIREYRVERAHARLLHVHLPILTELDIIEWDDGTVEFTDEAHKEQLLEVGRILEEWPPDEVLQSPSS